MVNPSFIPVEWLVPCRARDITGDAIIFPKAAYGGPVLVLGATSGPLRFYLEGESEFEILTPEGMEDFSGVVVEGVDVEVSLEGAEFIGGASAPLGAFAREGEYLQFSARTPTSLPSLVRTNIRSGLPFYTKFERTVFPNWRIVKMNGKEKVTLWATGLKD